MKRKFITQALILPLLIAFLILLPLLGAAVVGEHRYENTHPAYMHRLWMRLMGELTEENDIATVARAQHGCIQVLVMGKDRAAGLTDVLMIASLDTKQNTLHLIQIPRDTYAAYTDGSYKKLNGAYAKLGGEGVAAFLSENMGIPIDYYACIDLDVLGEMVNMIGGVPINIPDDMDYDDPSQNLHIHLKAGEQVLDGDTAQMFVRFRSGYVQADVGRMDAQKLFLSSLAKKTKENLSTAQTVSLVCKCFGKIKTNMSLSDCISCAKTLRKVELSELHMVTLPGAPTRTATNSGAWYYVLNKSATDRLLRDTLGDLAREFDPNQVFTDQNKSTFDRIYRASADSCRAKDYTAEGALDGIDIRRVS